MPDRSVTPVATPPASAGDRTATNLLCGKLGMARDMDDLRLATTTVPSADDPVLAEVVRRLAEAYHPERIYLFGSTARGEAGQDSDYDIMVVVPDESPPECRNCDLAYRVLRGLRVAKDVLVWPRTEFEKRLHLNASLPATVLREGKVMYAA